MRVSAAAMNAALEDFSPLRYSTQRVSLVESLLTAKWLEANNRYPDVQVNDANDAVRALFEFDSDHVLGRLYPFRYDWISSEASGRKTVWNNTTRGTKLATTLFTGDDLRNGLVTNALQIARDALAEQVLPSRQALAVLVLRDHEFLPGDDWAAAFDLLRERLALSATDLDLITDNRPLGVPLLAEPEWSIAALADQLRPPAIVAIDPPAQPGGAPVPAPDHSVVVDARVERMIRRCVSRHKCVLLVGPPGTGKGTLVRWIIDEIANNPAGFGFDPSLTPDPMWRTPDEGWSAFELVGGLAPDENAHLRWANGLLLDSLAENRWLVLDETNRADLDKIMGPLLTWLSGQDVEVGRTRAHGGAPVRLGWGDAAASIADEPDDDGNPTRFLAGADWRLLGTYNPQDAQRVFRMGQALSRRFVVVPVPALMPGQFENLFDGAFPELSEDARSAVSGLYSAHHGSPETLLGPAVFLRLGDYLVDAEEGQLPEFVAEAYVTNVGKFTSSFDDATFEALGTRVVEDEQVLSAEQWLWVSSQRQILG